MKALLPEVTLVILAKLYTFSLRFYPASFRSAYGEEMALVFRLRLADAAGRGWRATFDLVFREILSLLPGIIYAYAQVNIRSKLYLPTLGWLNFLVKGGSNMSIRQHFPKTVEQTSWWTAILSLVPFLLLGPLAPVLNYKPLWNWNPYVFPLIQAVQFPLTVCLLILGFLIGILWKFPRWVYLYTLYIFFLIPIGVFLIFGRIFPNILTGIVNNLFSIMVLLMIALFIIARRRLGFMRPYFSNIRHDSSLLSYALYAGPFFFFCMNDRFFIPSANDMVQLLLPSLITWVGALAYLRFTDPLKKAGALVGATLLAGLVYCLPMFDGSIISLFDLLGGLISVLMILAILCGMIIVPLLINIAFPPGSDTMK